MKPRLRYVAIGGVLIAVGLGLIVVGQVQHHVTDGRRTLLMLRYDAPENEYERLEQVTRFASRLPGIADLRADVRDQRTVSDYWRAQYRSNRFSAGASTTPAQQEARALLLAANAAYRRIALDGSNADVRGSLDAVLAQYVDVLKRDSSSFDAAYNYQFVARMRDRLERAPRAGTKNARAPVDQTLHGPAGSESPGLEINEFKVITPHDSNERKEEQEAGKGAPRVRKG
jgi:hypothetical protein